MYNKIPVYWCNACKSLAIMECETSLNEGIVSYCNKCFGTDIIKGSIEDWEKIINKQNI